MAKEIIGPRTAGAALVTIDSVEYNMIFTSMDFEFNTNQDDGTTLADEPDPVFEEGASIGRFAFAGRLTQGLANSGPILPLPQKKAVVMAFGGNTPTGNKLAFTGSFSQLRVSRVAMNQGILAAAGVVSGAIVKTWKTS